MFRNKFGEPKPANPDQLTAAIDELNINPATAMVLIEDSRHAEKPFTGWTAEIVDEDDVTLNTAGWEDCDHLEAALEQLGFEAIERG